MANKINYIEIIPFKRRTERSRTQPVPSICLSLGGDTQTALESIYESPKNDSFQSSQQDEFMGSNHTLTRLSVDSDGVPTGKSTSQTEILSGFHVAQAIAQMTLRENGTPGLLLATEAGLVISAVIATFLQANQIISEPMQQFETPIKIALLVGELVLAYLAYKTFDDFLKILHVAQKTGLSLMTIKHIAEDKSLITSRET